jgi:flavin-binding protein dodecin
MMADSVYSVSEIVGSSTEGIDDAVKGALTRAAQTLRNLDWFEVKEIRGHIEDDGNHYFQVTVKVGFRMEDRTK